MLLVANHHSSKRERELGVPKPTAAGASPAEVPPQSAGEAEQKASPNDVDVHTPDLPTQRQFDMPALFATGRVAHHVRHDHHHLENEAWRPHTHVPDTLRNHIVVTGSVWLESFHIFMHSIADSVEYVVVVLCVVLPLCFTFLVP